MIKETKMKSLREQMTEAMVLRGFAARTQEAYLAAVVALAIIEIRLHCCRSRPHFGGCRNRAAALADAQAL